MATNIPDQTRDASVSQDGQKHLSHNREQPNSQNNCDFSLSPNFTGIHLSPFNLATGENTQAGINSSVEDSPSSNPALHASLSQERVILGTGYSGGEGLPPASTRQDPSSIQLGPSEGIANSSTLTQLLQASQSIQLPNQIQNGHQSQHASRLAVHNGYETCKQPVYPISVPTETSFETQKLVGLTTPQLLSQNMGSNIQTTVPPAFMTPFIPRERRNFVNHPIHHDKLQHSPSSHAVDYTAQGLNQSQFYGRHPFEDNGFGMSGDQNLFHFAVSQPQQIPVVGGSFPINQEQIAVQQLQFARSQYFPHPGHIYENVSGQTQPPLSPPAMNSHVNANINVNLNEPRIEEPNARILPLPPRSTQTRQFVPIRPAASATTPIQDTARALAHVVYYDRVCHLCGKGFKSRKDLRRHIARMHIQKGRHPCQDPGCNQSFAEAHKLRRHFRTVHLKKRPFKCPDCDSAFGERGNMTQHHRKAHGAESNKVKRVKTG